MNFVLHLRGTLDGKSAVLLQRQLLDWTERQPLPPGSRWIVDFTAVERIGISGLFLLNELFRLAAQKQCNLRLCNLSLPPGFKFQSARAKTKIWLPKPSPSRPTPPPLGVAQRFSHLRQRLIAAQKLQGGDAAVSGYAIKETDCNARAKS